MAVKRSHDHAMLSGDENAAPAAKPATNASQPVAGDASTGTTPVSAFMPMFEQFRAELDEHHDRRERIIKASRDVTAASKKIIFTLQRVRTLNQPLPHNIIKSNAQYHSAITNSLRSVTPDLQKLNSNRYARQISSGVQEWMEAVSFQHYLTTSTLISHSDAAQQLRELVTATGEGDGGSETFSGGIELTYEDYVLGIYDMTGELMRFAITAMATSGALPAITEAFNMGETAPAGANTATFATDAMDFSPPENVEQPRRTLLTDLRTLRSALEALDTPTLGGPFAKDVEKKMEVMRQSVEKVERGLYGLVVRGAERPKGWVPDMSASSARVEVEG